MDLLDWTAALFLAVGPLLSVWIGLRRAEEILEKEPCPKTTATR